MTNRDVKISRIGQSRIESENVDSSILLTWSLSYRDEMYYFSTSEDYVYENGDFDITIYDVGTNISTGERRIVDKDLMEYFSVVLEAYFIDPGNLRPYLALWHVKCRRVLFRKIQL